MNKYSIASFLLIAIVYTWGQSTSSAQTIPRAVRVKITYEKEGQYLEQAVETIEAVNKVNAGTTVDYRAGHSVSLLPGFEAKNGSIFKAEIKPVTSRNEITLKLKAYPNPFDVSTLIDYDLPTDGTVNVWVTDLQGKVISQLVKDEKQPAGKHQVEWKPTRLEAGVYIPIVEANQQKVVGRIIKQ